MGKKTAAQSVIDRNNTYAELTRPEVAFDSLYGNRVMKPNPIPIADDDGQIWTLRPDRTFIGTNVLVAIDGVYHRTKRQEAKTRWEDKALNERGFRVLHIDTELLMAKKHHAYVRMAVDKFLADTDASRRIAA